jgi:hypothetical protein
MYINNKCPPVCCELGHFSFLIYMLLTF